MDYHVMATLRHFESEESQAEAACAKAAEAHGVLDRAQDCEDGALSCPSCPWKISDR